ncbi:aldo/keto reductase [Ectobacillus ponti]|uniref:Aldo/keto reductase n=1 Tax=Ectobacillus ponti TaxID=2961894 RepID=A0AA41X1D9_9BACI|nr:aldo/keto reductase [Ectobacillus ponti]MCP8966967.1 aldo/keto reductase [Ectobacillus ponti]
MKKRQLGTSDLYVSEVGLGCMSLGTDEQHAVSLIHAALEQGINYLDTADLYDYGMNEAFVGKALKGRRDQAILATKVGNRWTEAKDSWYWDPSKAYIKEEVKESLRRLGTDYIDLYQLHGGTMEDNMDEAIEAFEELKKEGIIRHYGISSIRPNVIREYAKRSGIVSVMMEYSILNRRPEEWFPLLQEHGISVIARGPLAKGLLTDRYEQKLSGGKGYLSYSHEELAQVLPHIRETAPGRPLGETAIQYCLHSQTVAAVIPGASSLEQLLQNAAAGKAEPLAQEEYAAIQAGTRADKYELHR